MNLRYARMQAEKLAEHIGKGKIPVDVDGIAPRKSNLLDVVARGNNPLRK